ncbi:hypothetical protein LTR66_002771 [Elasticomyces elasticus]|nr:hypothetical protein LTR50_002548 [Elasticomyces elasticus]KAK4997911.1 hypothetical protein LTR66_002771 [Elasticomyces elasticus]KAK5011596.1 hypothetical protein LTR28_012298 [Elasticomyces elasticus]
MAPSATTPTARSGIAVDANGERLIPASTRADGSVRREIRVRPGYRPPEDVELYKNRTAEAWKARGTGGVPGAETVSPTLGTAAATKNARRKEARKKAAAKDGKDEGDTRQAKADVKHTEAKPAEVEEALDPETAKVKEARKLSKKLRQARELKDKKTQGSALLPEQFEKVIRINELIRQLESLGFDEDGEKKAQP